MLSRFGFALRIRKRYSPVTVSYSFDSVSNSNEGTIYPTDDAATKRGLIFFILIS